MKGLPKALQKLVLVEEWNDFDRIEKRVRNRADEIAAIITEPIMANSSVIPPRPGYLKFLKELCDRNDIILIFDEVKTGFRVGKGGAQELFGVRPHLTALAKSFGNGYPISAVVGAKEIMAKFGSREILPQGTYARNPVSLAAADATIEEIMNGSVHSKIDRFGKALMKGLADMMHDKHRDAIVQGYPPMFQVLFTKESRVNNYREFSQCDQEQFEKLQKRMLKNGVMLDDSNSEPFYVSAAHDRNDVDRTLAVIDSSL
jgi:glutamate-1-semialdehyde 2,1-aminomutase